MTAFHEQSVFRADARGHGLASNRIEFEILLDTFQDLKIHFGINCASVSCVNLAPEPYRAGTLERQPSDSGKRFLGDPQKGFRIDRQKKTV